MLKKILSYGLIGMLVIALLAGTAYVVLRPSRDQVWQEHRDAGVTASGQGYRGGQSVTVNAERGVRLFQENNYPKLVKGNDFMPKV